MEKITDKNIQDIQNAIKKVVANESQSTGSLINIGPKESRKSYEIVHKIDGTTQALALAPIVNGQADYNQTTVVVAGT